MIEYTDDILKKVTTCGMLEYSYAKTVNVCSPNDEEDFIKQLKDKESKVYKAYKKGVDSGEFMIDVKLLDLAKNGNITAIQQLSNIKQQRRIENIKDEITK